MVWWYIIHSQSVMRKDWSDLFKIKVTWSDLFKIKVTWFDLFKINLTMMVAVIKIWLSPLYLMDC